MTDKKCPNCNLWNTGSAMICDCGYEFFEGSQSTRLTQFNSHKFTWKNPIALLIGLSLISALAIVSLWLLEIPALSSCEISAGVRYCGSGAIYPYGLFIVLAQFLLIVPASWLVFHLYKQLSDQSYRRRIDPKLVISIPLLLNFLSVSGLVVPAIVFIVFRSLGSH
jgi:hypothetical protein